MATSELAELAPEAGKTPEQLYTERSRRILDAAQLQQPDRIPILLRFGYKLAELEGVTRQELHEDPERAQAALEGAALRFQPDGVSGLYGDPGPSRALGDRMTKWPGYGLGPDGSYQFVEQEFMKAEEYDEFLRDPSDWAIRVYLPRAFSELQGLALLPPLGIAALGYYGVIPNLTAFLLPQVTSALESLAKGAQLQAEWVQQRRKAAQRLAALGFASAPFFAGPLIEAPFDFMSDTLRGMRGIFLDIHRRPDKLLAAEEKVAAFQIQYAIAVCRATGIPYVFFPLHRGSDEFMSLPQFERFYWPQLKGMFLKLIEQGITPFVFYEGLWDRRLTYLAELPKGKTIGYFQSSDIFKVKEVAGETMCIMGGMPVSMLTGGTREQVREHTKKLCQVVGKSGGFIMATSVGELEGCKPELIQTWVDATKEFGRY